jgi:hypothetical protein
MPIGPEEISRYTGIGIATLTLIESTVRATIRHSDSEPIASEAATASIRRDDATGAERLLKPAAPGDRVMAGNPSRRGRITRNAPRFAGIAGNFAAAAARKWQNDGD